jgi:beta-glucosidase
VVTILAGLREAAPGNLKITFAPGADPRKPDDDSGFDAAVKAVKAADVTVLVIGEDFDLSGEARSRSSLELPANQLELARRVLTAARTSKPARPVVVVLANGRPLALQWLSDNAAAILETWMLGVESGHAVADALFGRYSPAGRLPAAFPRVTGAVPGYYAANPTGRPADPDLAKDTVRYHDLPITPLYAFGHGLSYTEFKYGDLAQSAPGMGPGERIDISITVQNVGNVASDEVVQLYVRDPVASVSRPVLELRGFKRIELAPGARKRVTFTLTPEQLAFWTSRGWLIEAGRPRRCPPGSSFRPRIEGDSCGSHRQPEPSAWACSCAWAHSASRPRPWRRPWLRRRSRTHASTAGTRPSMPSCPGTGRSRSSPKASAGPKGRSG